MRKDLTRCSSFINIFTNFKILPASKLDITNSDLSSTRNFYLKVILELSFTKIKLKKAVVMMNVSNENDDVFIEKLISSGYYDPSLQSFLFGMLMRELHAAIDRLRRNTASVYQCESSQNRFIPRWRITGPNAGCEIIIDCRKKTDDSYISTSSQLNDSRRETNEKQHSSNESTNNLRVPSSPQNSNQKSEILKLTEVDFHDSVTDKISYICPDEALSKNNNGNADEISLNLRNKDNLVISSYKSHSYQSESNSELNELSGGDSPTDSIPSLIEIPFASSVINLPNQQNIAVPYTGSGEQRISDEMHLVRQTNSGNGFESSSINVQTISDKQQMKRKRRRYSPVKECSNQNSLASTNNSGYQLKEQSSAYSDDIKIVYQHIPEMPDYKEFG